MKPRNFNEIIAAATQIVPKYFLVQATETHYLTKYMPYTWKNTRTENGAITAKQIWYAKASQAATSSEENSATQITRDERREYKPCSKERI